MFKYYVDKLRLRKLKKIIHAKKYNRGVYWIIIRDIELFFVFRVARCFTSIIIGITA